jgi:ABC-type branched-subunit amino acid transport system ATPase component
MAGVLRGVSFAIRRGETVALMGRNGMGKTNLIRTLMGLVPSRSGRVLMDGLDITVARSFALARSGIAYVPEERSIFAISISRTRLPNVLVQMERSDGRGRERWSCFHAWHGD